MAGHHVRVRFPFQHSLLSQMMVVNEQAACLATGRLVAGDDGPVALFAMRAGPFGSDLRDSIVDAVSLQGRVLSHHGEGDELVLTGAMSPDRLESPAFRFLAAFPGIKQPFTVRLHRDTAEVYVPVEDLDQQSGVQRSVQKRLRDMGMEASIEVVDVLPEGAMALRALIPVVA